MEPFHHSFLIFNWKGNLSSNKEPIGKVCHIHHLVLPTSVMVFLAPWGSFYINDVRRQLFEIFHRPLHIQQCSQRSQKTWQHMLAEKLVHLKRSKRNVYLVWSHQKINWRTQVKKTFSASSHVNTADYEDAKYIFENVHCTRLRVTSLI